MSGRDRASEEDELAWLSARLREHNRQVQWMVVLALFSAAALWFVCYAGCYWATLLFLTVAGGVDTQPPRIFPALFIYGAALLMAAAWVSQKLTLDDRPKDERSVLGVCADFLLAIPRVTLAIGATACAWQSLSRQELEFAAEFVACLRRDGRMPLHGVPVEIPERRMRQKILLALQIAGVIQVARKDRVAWISLVPDNRPGENLGQTEKRQ